MKHCILEVPWHHIYKHTELQLPPKDLHEIGSINIQSWMGEMLRLPYPSLRISRLLIVSRGGRDIFFTDLATKLSMIL